jgi:serine/threonine-protein kinase SRK2
VSRCALHPPCPPLPPPPPQALLDKASGPSLPTEEVLRLSLSKIKRAYSILGPRGAGMDALAEED